MVLSRKYELARSGAAAYSIISNNSIFTCAAPPVAPLEPCCKFILYFQQDERKAFYFSQYTFSAQPSCAISVELQRVETSQLQSAFHHFLSVSDFASLQLLPFFLSISTTSPFHKLFALPLVLFLSDPIFHLCFTFLCPCILTKLSNQLNCCFSISTCIPF